MMSDADPLGFIRTPKPLSAPSPVSHTNTSRPPARSGQIASTVRLLSFGTVGSAGICFLGCFPEPKFGAGEAIGKQQGGKLRNVTECSGSEYLPKMSVASMPRIGYTRPGTTRKGVTSTLPRLGSGVRIPSPAPELRTKGREKSRPFASGGL